MQQSRKFSRFNICVLIDMGKAHEKGTEKSSQKIENCDLDNTVGVLGKLWMSSSSVRRRNLRCWPAFPRRHQYQRFLRFHFRDWYRIEAIYLGIWFHQELSQAKFLPTPPQPRATDEISFDELEEDLPKAHSPQTPLPKHVYNKFA